MVQRAGLEAEQVLALYQVGVDGIFIDLCDDRLVEARRHRIDQFHARHELAMLLGGDLAGDEDAQMPDALMHRIDDGLDVLYDLALVVVEIENPTQRLLRRRDIVAP